MKRRMVVTMKNDSMEKEFDTEKGDEIALFTISQRVSEGATFGRSIGCSPRLIVEILKTLVEEFPEISLPTLLLLTMKPPIGGQVEAPKSAPLTLDTLLGK